MESSSSGPREREAEKVTAQAPESSGDADDSARASEGDEGLDFGTQQGTAAAGGAGATSDLQTGDSGLSDDSDPKREQTDRPEPA